MCFALLKYFFKISRSLSALTFCVEQLETVSSFRYLRIPIIASNTREMSRIRKAMALFANLRHQWLRHDIRLFLKKRMHNVASPNHFFTAVRCGFSALRMPGDFCIRSRIQVTFFRNLQTRHYNLQDRNPEDACLQAGVKYICMYH